MPRRQFYQVKGTMAADVPSYVVRAADGELHHQVEAGEYCYVLTARQMGKSSLMIRTAERLRAEGTLVATVDLTGIGGDEQSVTADQWYYGFASVVLEGLGLEDDLDAWWDKRTRLPALKRVGGFFREILLAKTSAPIVIFVDEIDTTLNLSFAGDFFAAIRACFNNRAQDPEYRRLTFVLLGVATPNELIANPRRTPFNIGNRIELSDFQHDEALPLAEGLGSRSAERREAFERILFWTDGHPYLTQKACQLAAESPNGGICSAEIDRIVETHFFAPDADRKDDNLIFVRNRLVGKGAMTRRILALYRQVRRGELVKDEPTSAIQNELKLTGLVKVGESGSLIVRNRIYERVFGDSWINEVLPPASNWKRVTGAGFISLLITVAIGYWLVYPWFLIDTLSKAKGEEANLARLAYERLGAVLFYGDSAQRHWGQYNLRRSQWAVDLDEQPNRHQEAYRAAESAHAESSRLPDLRAQSDEFFGEFLKRRAIRAAFAEQRDEAILWWLKALTVLPAHTELRRTVSQLVDPDYMRLVRTIRTGITSHFVIPTREQGDSAIPGEWGASISHDGRLLATVGVDGIVRLWNLDRVNSEPLLLHRRTAAARALAIGPDGEYLAVGQENGEVLLWRVDQPNFDPQVLKSVPGPIGDLVFGPNGKHLVSDSFVAEDVLLWRTDRPRESPAVLKGRQGPKFAVAFSRDEARIVIVGHKPDANGEWVSTARVWRTERPGADPIVFRPQRGTVNAVAFSPDGAHFVTLDHDSGALRFCRLDQPAAELDGKSQIHWKVPNDPSYGSIAVSPDHSRFVTFPLLSSMPSRALLWRFDRPQEPLASLAENGIIDVALSPDGSRIVTGGVDGDVRIWQPSQSDAVPVLLRAHGAVVMRVAFRHDGSQLISLDASGTVRVWNVKGLTRPAGASVKHGDAIRSIALSPDGSHLVTVNENGEASLWKLDEPDTKRVALRDRRGDHAAGSLAVAFSPDSTRLAISDAERTIRIQRVDRPKDQAMASMVSKSIISSFALSPDGRRLAAACVDGDILIWRLDQPAADPLILKGRGEVYQPLVFSPDGAQLIIVQGKATRIWRIDRASSSPVEPTELAGNSDVVAFSPDSKTLVRLGSDGKFAMWREDHTFTSPVVMPTTSGSARERERALAFSPDGTTLFVASPGWAHSLRVDGTSLTPWASRPFPNLLRSRSDKFFRFLDQSGKRLQVAVMPTLDKVNLETLRFDTDHDPPIEGDPETLLTDWQKRLALKFGDDGEIVPAN